jgi:hypothetical protein
MVGPLLSLLLLAVPAVPAPARLHLFDVPLTVVVAAGWLGLDHAAAGLTRTTCPCDRFCV